jgi:hypothetical protein
MSNQIREKIISNFIEDNLRAPTQQEINLLYNKEVDANNNIEDVGLLVSKSKKYFSANEESSKRKYNDIIENLNLDSRYLLESIEDKVTKLENTFRQKNKQINRELSKLKSLERTVNKNLLLHLKEDIFLNGVVESFENYDKIDFQNSNIAFYNGKATVGFSKVASGSFNFEDIEYSVRSRSGEVLSARNVSSFENIKSEDGAYFKVLAEAKSKYDHVDFVLDISFKNQEGEDLETIKFTSYTPEVNSKASYQCYISTDGNNFVENGESNLRLKDGENFIEVNKSGVKKVKILISKFAYDYKENGRFIYTFSLDYLGFTKNKYKINEESVLYLGPYEILDEESNPVKYSMASARGGTCCIIPDETSIDLYLSKDNVSWHKVDFTGRSKEVVQFYESEESATDFTLFDLIDRESRSSFLAETLPENINLKPSDKILNLYIPNENKDLFIKDSISIKRNTLKKDNEKIYEASRGWYKKLGFYYTNFEIDQPEGRYIDFGMRSCFVDGRLVTGRVFLTKGTHTFKTSEENWYNLDLNDEKSVKTSRQLKEIDPLYPYNHKYLIEGYGYSKIFRGKKVYLGTKTCFGYEMSFVSKERFLREAGLDKFTFIETEQGLFIKIKVDETRSDSKIEDFDITYRRTLEEDSNLLYVKAVLKTANEDVTPKIDQIQVRVI